jgi:hypothetical protein
MSQFCLSMQFAKYSSTLLSRIRECLRTSKIRTMNDNFALNIDLAPTNDNFALNTDLAPTLLVA